MQRITLCKATEIGCSLFLRHLCIQIDKFCRTNLDGTVTDVCKRRLVRHGIRNCGRNSSTRIEVDSALSIRYIRLLSHQEGLLKNSLRFTCSTNSSTLGLIVRYGLISVIDILRNDVTYFVITLTEQTIILLKIVLKVIGRTIIIVFVILACLVLLMCITFFLGIPRIPE